MDRPDLDPARHLDDLAAFISGAPSPFDAAAVAAERLEAVGFRRVDETEPWPDSPGRYVLRRGGSLLAWSTEAHRSPRNGFRIVGTHTDSPNLRLRPRPDMTSIGMAQLGVEIYGGSLLNSWLDRDLGLSGRVAVLGDDGSSDVLVKFDEPLLRIPQLAIHLDRSISTDGLRRDPQHHLQPVWGVRAESVPGFRTWLADRLDVEPDHLLAWDLMTHDLTPPRRLGVDGSMFAASRIDNLLSCHAALAALLMSVDCDGGSIPVVCMFDHEEVGSQSASGAAGQLLPTILERISLASGLSRDEWFAACAASLCISADGAHATHPNWPERHEPNHQVFLDQGPVLKWNADARYATDAPGASRVLMLARNLDIPVQTFVSRNDVPCGSTIGPVTAARLGIATVDVGVAQLSMHSAREVTGVVDPARFATLLQAFLSESTSPKQR